jgi:alpha-tubulin suppressor-like RCC1 family protein
MPSLYSWGLDIYGRLGHGTVETNLHEPKEIATLSSTPLSFICTGSAHNVIACEDGRVMTWGKCHRGQLGLGEMDVDKNIPTPLEALKGQGICFIACGDSHCVAVNNTGKSDLNECMLLCSLSALH